MSEYRYVLSPHGAGLDYFRTWEALLIGCIPVVKTSTLDPLYEGLPVIIVQDWNDITEEYLAKEYERIKNKTIKREKLFMDYWTNLILADKTTFLKAGQSKQQNTNLALEKTEGDVSPSLGIFAFVYNSFLRPFFTFFVKIINLIKNCF